MLVRRTPKSPDRRYGAAPNRAMIQHLRRRWWLI
jgi:hypothetical protein